MNPNYLQLCEIAKDRAAAYLDMGAYNSACTAYLEAAEHMLQFAQTVQGEMKKNAQLITEQLITKAKAAKAHAEASLPDVRPPKDHAEAALVDATPSKGRAEAAPPDVRPPKDEKKTYADNGNAITRDIESFQRKAAGRVQTNPENRLKFAPVASPNVKFSDIAGLENVKSIIRMKVIEPILHPELYERFNKSSNGGILLYGPPGTGKTMIARAIATETKLDFFSVRCSDIVGKTFGDGERNLKALFDAARESGHAMVFFDEFESLACKRGGHSTVMNRIVPELLSQMDGFQKAEGTLIVLASTNRPWDLDSAVLRPPRMTERIYVGLPDFQARHYMVMKELQALPKQELLDYDQIAAALEGYNCADIAAFVEKVKEKPIERGVRCGDFEQYITLQDVEEALAASRSSVQKSDLEAFSRWEASQQ